MRLIRPIKSIDWRYAIGEIALIAIGVLIALGASDWQSNRAARNSEIITLNQIAESLTQDRDQLLRWCTDIRDKEQKLIDLLAHLRAGQPYAESLNALFGSVYGFGGVPPNRAAYESLKSQGMDIVSDHTLRNQISVVFEKTYWLIENSIDLSRETVLDLLRPYYLRNFSDIRFSQNAAPLDYEATMADVHFLNLLEYRLQQIQAVHNPMCEFAPKDMDSLLSAIAANVGDD